MTSSSTQQVSGDVSPEETVQQPQNQVLDDIFGAYVQLPEVVVVDPEDWTRDIVGALNNPIRTTIPNVVPLSCPGPEATRSGFQTKSDFVMQGSKAL